MKYLLTALTLAVLLATPAAAKNRHAISRQAAAAQAYEPRDQDYRSPNSDIVVEQGMIVGRDPDPNVRYMLRRDATLSSSY